MIRPKPVTGTPQSLGRNTSFCPFRQGISCCDGTGPVYPGLAYAQYHAKIGSSWLEIARPLSVSLNCMVTNSAGFRAGHVAVSSYSFIFRHSVTVLMFNAAAAFLRLPL